MTNEEENLTKLAKFCFFSVTTTRGGRSRYLLRDGNLSSISTNFFPSPCAHVNRTRKCTPTWRGAAPPHPLSHSHIQKKRKKSIGTGRPRTRKGKLRPPTLRLGQFSYYTMSFRSYFRCNLLISICFFPNRTCATLLAANCFLSLNKATWAVRWVWWGRDGRLYDDENFAILGRKKAGQER